MHENGNENNNSHNKCSNRNGDFIDDVLYSLTLLLLIILTFGFVMLFGFKKKPKYDHVLSRILLYINNRITIFPSD